MHAYKSTVSILHNLPAVVYGQVLFESDVRWQLLCVCVRALEFFDVWTSYLFLLCEKQNFSFFYCAHLSHKWGAATPSMTALFSQGNASKRAQSLLFDCQPLTAHTPWNLSKRWHPIPPSLSSQAIVAAADLCGAEMSSFTETSQTWDCVTAVEEVVFGCVQFVSTIFSLSSCSCYAVRVGGYSQISGDSLLACIMCSHLEHLELIHAYNVAMIAVMDEYTVALLSPETQETAEKNHCCN